jgi:hypothetical protein
MLWSREFWLNCGADSLVQAGPPDPLFAKEIRRVDE